MKNTEISVLILQGSKQADCEEFSTYVMSAFTHLHFFLKKKPNRKHYHDSY